MNELTEILLKTYKPRLAIVVYTPESDKWHEAYLESHEINADGQLLEGKALKEETIEELVDVFFDERQNRAQIKGLIPNNLLKFEVLPGGHFEMIWYRTEEKRHIYFAESLHLKSGIAWVPSMVYHVRKDSLSVYAFDSNERPDEKTQLFHAPFHNVGDTGSVCLGSAKVKKPSLKTYESVIKYWEDMFWLSEFTHLAHAENPTKTNLNLIWKKLIGSDIMWSDMDELQEIKKLILSKIL